MAWVLSGLTKKEYYASNKTAAKLASKASNNQKCKCKTCANHEYERVFSFTGEDAGKTASLAPIHAHTSTSMTNNNILLPNTFPLIVYGQNGKSIVATAMADQGAAHGSYMSHEFAAKVDEIGGRRVTCNKQVCGGAGSDRCEYSTTCHSIKAGIIPNAMCNILTNEMTISFTTTAINGDYDIIVGKPLFIQYNLYDIMRPLLMQPAPPNNGEIICTFIQPGEYLTDQSLSTDTAAQPLVNGLYNTYKPYGWGALTSDAMLDPTASAEVDESLARRPLRALAKSAAEGTYYIQGPGSDYLRDSLSAADRGEEAYIRVPMTNEATWPTQPEVMYDFSSPEGNGEVRGWMTSAELAQLEAEHPTLPTQYWGTTRERQEYVALCAEFNPLFKTELTREPADIPPLEIKFDRTGWEGARGTRLPSRPMNQEKQAAARDIMETQQRLEIVSQNNDSNAWSQMQIVWKKVREGFVKKARAVVDYRIVNNYVSDSGWPIPNISELLTRIGTFRPTRFCCIDLKDGYWQAPLHPNSRWITAFTVATLGMFVYNRVPMGIKCAAAYFQFMMATVVLTELVGHILEVYLDDIIVHDEGKGHAQFLSNLRRTFIALQKRRVVISASKFICGVPQVQALGHLIDGSGTTHSRESLDKVIDVEKPTFKKGLKSLLGLTQYFSPHIENYALIVQPLHDLIKDYPKTKNNKIQWTVAGEEAFEAIKAAVNA